VIADDHEIELGIVSGVSEIVAQAPFAIGVGRVTVHIAPEDVVLGVGGMSCQNRCEEPDREAKGVSVGHCTGLACSEQGPLSRRRRFYHAFHPMSRMATVGMILPIRGKPRGPVRIDKEHPWHFVWEGSAP